ncbi:MAG: thiamine-phosphate kinase [Desulfomonile tiedjei]|uniref:Thiamine-monophosphate kinase n=1 Tax=Desulfomonile tiedjei TaxID=2358 RepID=A0A9D6V518_9BACT|nr:thiamine-phosphate kinase [Desulfomonile tiedjei]
MKLKEIGEFGFIDRIAPLGSIRASGVIKGIGDDCAVMSVPGDDYLLVTTDLLVEKVHFLLDWASPQVIGAKSLAVNLSDIAACGGEPLDAFISIAVPEYIDVEWLDGFYKGMSEIARQYGVNLLGGDTTASKGHLVINVALTGRVPVDQVLFRHTARPGDILVLTGPTGESAAGTEILLSQAALPEAIFLPLIRSHLEPRPHVSEGRFLAQSGVCNAAIDVSDGLSSDLGHICRDSGVGAVVYQDRLPQSPPLLQAASLLEKDPLSWMLHGGEDYVLLASVKSEGLQDLLASALQNGLFLIPIGETNDTGRMELIRPDDSRADLTAKGWNHFR